MVVIDYENFRTNSFVSDVASFRDSISDVHADLDVMFTNSAIEALLALSRELYPECRVRVTTKHHGKKVLIRVNDPGYGVIAELFVGVRRSTGVQVRVLRYLSWDFALKLKGHEEGSLPRPSFDSYSRNKPGEDIVLYAIGKLKEQITSVRMLHFGLDLGDMPF